MACLNSRKVRDANLISIVDHVSVMGNEGQLSLSPRRFPLNEDQVELAWQDLHRGIGRENEQYVRCLNPSELIANGYCVVMRLEMNYLLFHRIPASTLDRKCVRDEST